MGLQHLAVPPDTSDTVAWESATDPAFRKLLFLIETHTHTKSKKAER